MDKLDCIKLFCHVARLGSFTAAANELNVTQGAVSKKIAWLEGRLGVSLFNRNSRKISLTEKGGEYLAFSNELIEKIEATELQLKGVANRAVGKLKISAPSAFATQRLAEPIKQFMEINPDVLFDISVNDKQIDLFADDIDIAIRASFLKDSGLKAKSLLTHQVCYFASPAYIGERGIPESPQDLCKHACITYSLSTPSHIWYLQNQKVTVGEVLKTDNPEMAVKMALLGSGITAMPIWMVKSYFESGELVELFQNIKPAHLPMYAVYKDTDYLPYKIRAFVDFLSEYFENN